MSTSRQWSAWSCTVRLVVDDPLVIEAAATDLRVLLARVDAVASRFRPDSALSRANANAGRPVAVPRELAELVDCALNAAGRTSGAVDPTIGLSLVSCGYDRDIADLPQDGDPVRPAAPRSDWRAVGLDRERGLLRVPAGTALDLGATAKAFTADRAARTLHARYGTPVLVELGGDLAAYGSRPGGWPLFVAEREGGDGELVVLHDGGLATSSTTLRTWRRGGRQLHHILDPNTGEPTAGRWRTITVAAESAVEANTASTAAIVLGDRATQWLSEHRLAARLVDRDGSIVTTPGWPRPESVRI